MRKSTLFTITVATLLTALLHHVSSLQASSPSLAPDLFQSPLAQPNPFRSPLPTPGAKTEPTRLSVPDTISTLFVSPLSEPAPDAPQTSLTLQKGAPPIYYDPVGASGQQLHGASKTLSLPAGMSAGPSSSGSGSTGGSASDPNLVDKWTLHVKEDFEGGYDYPRFPCRLYYDGNDPERYWSYDDYNPFNDSYGGWSAAGGMAALDPAVSDYPASIDTWLVCGPFDLSQADHFLVRFACWLEIYDPGDRLFFGLSNEGMGPYQGWEWMGESVRDWTIMNVHARDWAGDSEVWVAWAFQTDDDGDTAQGAWIDDLEVWSYDTPQQTCGGLDPGDKGAVLNAYEQIGNEYYPIIRAGDTMALDGLVAADARWVRMVFEEKTGVVDLRAYDRMVDTLCANGISVLGVLNHQTLYRKDIDDPNTAADYRQEFAGAASSIAKHYQVRITYWEVWNEENYDPDPSEETAPPWVNPVRYAPFLQETYQAIKNANANAQVLFGGLGSAWNDSRDYLVDVYGEWNSAGHFDYFAVHPYFDDTHGLDPAVYMHSDPGYDTILDKFMETMHGRGDGSKKTWITEVGWNSAQGHPDVGCKWNVVITAQEQATFLKIGFDILFNEVDLWATPWIRAVNKAIWYQYMDIGQRYDDVCWAGMAGGMGWKGYVPAAMSRVVGAGQATSNPDVPWWFGLYHGDKKTPKPSQCAFMAYPGECRQVFLPVVLKNH